MDLKRQLSIVPIGLIVLTGNAHAFRGELAAGLGAEYSDNATLVDTGEQSELTGIALLAFRGHEESSMLRLDFQSLVERRNYQDNVFSDETLFNLGGNLDWSIFKDRLKWYAGDYFTQESPDRLSPQTPDNTVNANAFSTGPDLMFRLGSVNRVLIGGRYTDYYFEDDTSDSERQSASAVWVHQLPREGELSATIASENAEFTETPTNQDFQRHEIFASYAAVRGESTFRGDLGASRIDRDVGDDIDGFLGRVNWLRQLGSETAFELDAYSQYTDAGTNLLNSGVQRQAQTVVLGNEQLSADVLYDERIGATYRYGGQVQSVSLGVFVRNEDYETALLDRESNGIQIDANRLIAASLTGTAYLSYTDNDYTDINETQKDTVAGIGLDYRLSRSLTVGADLTRNMRDSDVAGSDYDENRFLLVLYYGADPYSFR